MVVGGRRRGAGGRALSRRRDVSRGGARRAVLSALLHLLGRALQVSRLASVLCRPMLVASVSVTPHYHLTTIHIDN